MRKEIEIKGTIKTIKKLSKKHRKNHTGTSKAANNITVTCNFLRGLSIREVFATNLICT